MPSSVEKKRGRMEFRPRKEMEAIQDRVLLLQGKNHENERKERDERIKRV